MPGPNTRDPVALSGAMFFIVGRGTEGGAASYRLSVAGVTDSTWGDASHVRDNSGYSIGTIQVDLGQRGSWPIGSIDGAPDPAQPAYVDAVIDQSAAYARAHGLPFADDHAGLRADLMTHGNGQRGRSTISFIDSGTRASINDWAASDAGKKWVHTNVDYPQVRNATETATQMVNSFGRSISDDHRLETIALLTKTANQYPAKLNQFRSVMENGGSFDDVMNTAIDIKSSHPSYAGPEAADVAARYKAAFADPERAAALERAQAKVASREFDPSAQTDDADFREALGAIGQPVRSHSPHSPVSLRAGSTGDAVRELQSHLNELGVTDTRGHALTADGHFGPATRAAVESFQRSHAMTADGIAGAQTSTVLQGELDRTRESSRMSLSDSQHPGASLYRQAFEGVRAIDERLGRESDQASCNLAGSLAVAACSAGLKKVDHVVMSDDGSRAYAVQGALNSPFKSYIDVDVGRSVTVPLEQSGAEFLRVSREQAQQHQQAPVQQQAPSQEAPSHHPVMHR